MQEAHMLNKKSLIRELFSSFFYAHLERRCALKIGSRCMSFIVTVQIDFLVAIVDILPPVPLKGKSANNLAPATDALPLLNYMIKLPFQSAQTLNHSFSIYPAHAVLLVYVSFYILTRKMLRAASKHATSLRWRNQCLEIAAVILQVSIQA